MCFSMSITYVIFFVVFFFFSSRRRHTRCALVTGVQTCALPIFIKLIPENERLLAIEETRERVVPHQNVVHMIYSKDGTGTAKVSAKELLESALRMRPDRILLQELRDGTAFFYLRNVNSGHPGSITTI